MASGKQKGLRNREALFIVEKFCLVEVPVPFVH